MTHACYLLRSLNPRFKSSFYIGCTTDPRRRIRQHNGEMAQGAQFTKKKRPWEMILCVYGFTSHVNALQFEWAWQHPLVSLAVKEAAAKLPSMKGISGMIKLVCTMVTLPKWNSLNLTLQFMISSLLQHRQGSPPLPPQMRLVVAPVHSLPAKDTGDSSDDDDLITCPDDLSQSIQLDEDCGLNASSSLVEEQLTVSEGGLTAELQTHDILSSPCSKAKDKKISTNLEERGESNGVFKDKTPMSICETILSNGLFQDGTQKSVTSSRLVIDGYSSAKSTNQDSDAGDSDIDVISVEEFRTAGCRRKEIAAPYICSSTERVARGVVSSISEHDRVQIMAGENNPPASRSVQGVEAQQKSLKAFFRVRKQAAAVPTSIYKKSRNGELCQVLQDHSTKASNAPNGVESKGKLPGMLPDTKRTQGLAVLIDSDDDEVQEISVTEFNQITFGGTLGATRKGSLCSLTHLR